MGFSGLVCKNVHCSGASGAHAPGGQQVSDTVARIAELSARSRDFSMMSPNGARRRCPTAGCQTQNGRSDDEYDSIPLYGSRNTSCTRPPVSLSSPRDLSRSSRSMTRSHAPTAVGTSGHRRGSRELRGGSECARDVELWVLLDGYASYTSSTSSWTRWPGHGRPSGALVRFRKS